MRTTVLAPKVSLRSALLRKAALAMIVVTSLGVAVEDAWAAPTSRPPPKVDKVDKGDKVDELSRARALDKEGAKAYAEGRYRDAIHSFEEAYRLGGPAFELWNIAKCHVRLDETQQAAEMLERYVALPNLPKEDRDEAKEQLESLKKRASTLTVSSTPSGAQVAIDGKNIDGRTPLSVSIAAGAHTVTVSSSTSSPYSKQIEARYGRPVTVDAGSETRPPPPDNPYGVQESSAIVLRGAIGIAIPRFGSIGGRVGANFMATGTYRLARFGTGEQGRSDEGGSLAVGGLFSASGDTWNNRTGTGNVSPTCSGPLNHPQSGTALAVYGIGTVTVPLARNLRATALGGIGLAGYAVDDVGGNLFVPSCSTAPGVRPALVLGAQLDYAITSLVHLSAFPLTWQAQPAFDGVRASPRDASSIWMRFGVAIGAGVNL